MGLGLGLGLDRKSKGMLHEHMYPDERCCWRMTWDFRLTRKLRIRFGWKLRLLESLKVSLNCHTESKIVEVWSAGHAWSLSANIRKNVF